MATTWKAPTWRMPNEKNQSKFENYSLNFDSGSPWLELESAADPLPIFTPQDKKFSVSVWIKPDDATPAANEYLYYIMSAGGGGKLGFWLDTTGKINFRVFSGSAKTITSTATLADNTWYHIVGTWDGNTINLYIDGASAATPVAATDAYNSTTGNTWATFGAYRFGATGASKGGWYTGEAGQLAIWNNIALSESQISSLYNSGSPINPMTIKPAPIAYYPLGGNASTGGDSSNTLSVPNVAVPDASVFDFDGTNPDYIDCGTGIGDTIGDNYTGGMAISLWFKADTTAGSEKGLFIFEGSTAWGEITAYFFLGKLELRVEGNDKNLDYTFSDTSSFHHLLINFLGPSEDNQVYLDGAPIGSTFTYTDLDLSGKTLNIGYTYSTTYDYQGEMSNFQIWNTSLSASEITTLYNSGVPLTGTQPQAANLKAWYKLDQSANWEADAASTWQIPDNRSAYPQSFDFSLTNNNSINIGNNTLLAPTTNPFTFSAWIKPNNWSATYSVIYATPTTNGIWIGKESSNGFVLRASNDANYLTHTLPTAGEWTHIFITRNASNLTTLYYNGVSQNTATVTKDFVQGTTYIGSDNANNEFNGEISNVAYWNSDQSSEISNIYNSGVPLTTAIASDNLKGWWKLDNTATFSTNWSVPDASGNGHTGTSSGMTEQNLVNNNVSVLNGESSGMDTSNLVTSTLTRQVPYNSYSLNFDSGSSDYIDCGDSDTFSFGDGTSDSPFSVSAWIKTTVGTNKGIISKYGSGNDKEWILYVVGPNKIQLGLWDNNTSVYQLRRGNTDVNTGEWFHVLATYDGRGGDGTNTNTANQGIKIYINGVEESAYTDGKAGNYEAMHNTIAPVQIGAYVAIANFDGQISNTEIWGTELTSTEVLKIYNSGVPSDLSNFNPSPIAWWSLGSDSYFNGSNWICPDLIGSNNGTSSNMDDDALIGDAPNSTVNGTSTNMSVDANLTGNAPNSSNNSFSVNMDYADRETSVPS